MTATVILQLAQEGKLSLDDPITKYQPDVPNGDNITIANLLDMRSGLYGYSKPALFAPGTAYAYSNTNYVLLGLVMEHVTGQTASELFKERLFGPLGLEDTTLPTRDDASIPSVYAHGYQFTSAEKAGGPDAALTPEQQHAAADGKLLPTDWSAGSVISTARRAGRSAAGAGGSRNGGRARATPRPVPLHLPRPGRLGPDGR